MRRYVPAHGHNRIEAEFVSRTRNAGTCSIAMIGLIGLFIAAYETVQIMEHVLKRSKPPQERCRFLPEVHAPVIAP
jgi:hypothetical protein